MVPDLGVTVAGLAVAVSLVMLLVYLNRLAHDLRPVAIADNVCRTGLGVLGRYLRDKSHRPLLDEPAHPPDSTPTMIVPCTGGGAS